LAEFAKRNKTIPLALMRYLPVYHGVYESLVTNELSEEEYPYVTPPPQGQKKGREGKSARKSNKPGDWRNKGGEEKEEEDSRPRYIVFGLGGITSSEMRSLYEVADAHKANLFIGSTNTLGADDYIRELSDLSPEDFERAVRISSGGASAGDDDDDEDSDARKTAAATAVMLAASASSSGTVKKHAPAAPHNDDDDEDYNKLGIKFDKI